MFFFFEKFYQVVYLYIQYLFVYKFAGLRPIDVYLPLYENKIYINWIWINYVMVCVNRCVKFEPLFAKNIPYLWIGEIAKLTKYTTKNIQFLIIKTYVNL